MKRESRQGNSITAVILMSAVGSIAVGSVITASMSYLRMNQRAYQLERSFFLAEAGVQAALVELNSGEDGQISFVDSKPHFATTSQFYNANWGFETAVSNVSPGVYRVESTGQDGTESSAISVLVGQQAGNMIHALYEHALYAGNSSGDSNYVLEVGGTGSGADFVVGDTYSGNELVLSGDAVLRNPETYEDLDGDGLWSSEEPWNDAHLTYSSGSNWPHSFPAPVSSNMMAVYESDIVLDEAYINREYNFGEMFVDTIGNGVYDTTEGFVDLDGNGVYSTGDTFTDGNSNGVWDAGEEFVDLGNGIYDAGEEYQDLNGNGQWDDAIPGEWVPPVDGVWHNGPWGGGYWDPEPQAGYWTQGTPSEPFEDLGNGSWDPGESFVDGNGVYDEGEPYVDDRNGVYDYGTQATDDISGMPNPASTGLYHAVGQNIPIDPPNLFSMYYDQPNTNGTPLGASAGWGHDIEVAAQPFDGNGRITDANNPAHIFVKNPGDRTYTPIPGKNDYFLEDPTDSTFSGSGISVPNPGGSPSTLTMRKLDVKSNGNNLLYFVDGNLYIHNPYTHIYQFRTPGVFLTIVARGNITISDELRYNGGTTNALDMMALIAMRDPSEPNSGNIYMGDAQFGTGGEVHSMLYAENNFIDNNLDTAGQPYLSVFGNMTAGNHVLLDRSPPDRTRLDIALDERIRDRTLVPPGLPPGQSFQRGIGVDLEWSAIQGSWDAYSPY